jgi:hypothetical protein
VTLDDIERRRDSGRGVDGALGRSATCGTLAPGRPNHHQLDGLEGRWLKGHVHGMLVDAGWGASLGYPALVLDPAGSAIGVDVFESVDSRLTGHVWTTSRDLATSASRQPFTFTETSTRTSTS